MARSKSKTDLSYPERLDIPQVTLSEARDQILLSLKSKQRRGCIVLVGESGLGKTQIFSQICKELEYNLNPIHTAHWGLMGSGIPRKAEGDFFDVAVPSVFPKPGEKSILLFDELNRGLKHAIAQFFTLLEDGSMFNYRLPEDCLVVGTMNPDTAAYAVTNIENEAAIRRRVKFLYVIPEFTGWYNHAKTEKFHAGTAGPAQDKPCHPQILEYFKANPKLLYDDKARDQGKQYICPATVETISEDAYNMEADNISTHGSYARIRYSSSIGLTGTAQLIEHIKDSSVMLGATDILNGYTKKAQKAVKQLAKNGQQEKLADLCENVLSLLFAEKPDVRATVVSFLGFCGDLPPELTTNMLFQMNETAKQAGASTYLVALMEELQKFDVWTDMQLAIDTNHRKIDEGIRS